MEHTNVARRATFMLILDDQDVCDIFVCANSEITYILRNHSPNLPRENS